jgi:DNA gyrase subunit A
VVLPARVPNLLVNGSSGIAVGMATNIPPHNLREIVDACIHLIDNRDATVLDLMQFVKGPDFPTAGYVHGIDGIREAYETGRGRMIMRARAEIEGDDGAKPRIIVTEIPFMVNKARMIEQIAQLVREKKLTDITDLRDESDRDGMRVVIELRRDAIAEVVLNQLYKHTQMQATFGAIMLALVNGVPKVMNLRELLAHYVAHREVVVRKRAEYDIRKAKEREHVLEGLKIAVDNIDEVVAIIRGSDDTESADARLRERFGLSEIQSKAILDMRLARLTGLEIEKLEAELAEVRSTIEDLTDILGSEPRRWSIVKDELREVAGAYGDERRTEIVADATDLTLEDLIADEPMVVTVSHAGYVKRLPVDTYRAQRRGGRGRQGATTKEEDWVEHLFVANTHDYIMFFTPAGHCYWLKVHQIPIGSTASRGKPIVNVLSLDPDERIAAMVPVREFPEDRWLMFATRQGVVKKTSLSAYGNVRSVGLNAINVLDGDVLIDVQITDGDDEAAGHGRARHPPARRRRGHRHGRAAPGHGRGRDAAGRDRSRHGQAQRHRRLPSAAPWRLRRHQRARHRQDRSGLRHQAGAADRGPDADQPGRRGESPAGGRDPRHRPGNAGRASDGARRRRRRGRRRAPDPGRRERAGRRSSGLCR